MIATLVGIGLLFCLLASGFYGAALALRDLDARTVPKLGPSYRLYAAASDGYCRRRDSKISTLTEGVCDVDVAA